jgi:HSP20 family protein
MHLEIDESDQSLNVRAEVPGFTAKELDIEVEGDRLTISGKHEAKEENTKGQTIYAERCSNRIFRSIRLPSHVDGPKAKATLKDGILSIELPKADHGKSVRIEPKAAS